MQVCFVFIFIIFSFYSAAGIENGYPGESYVGNPDNFAEIVRPCPVYDLNCIRKFLASHSQCKVTNGPLPDSIVIDQYDVYLPTFNVTCTLTNKVTTGFSNTRIEEFYVNYATDQFVFAIEARNQTDFSPSVYFKFNRRGREPVVVNTDADMRYRSITYTAVIPNIKNLQFDQMEVTAYVSDFFIAPPFRFGNEVLLNLDPAVQQSLAEIAANPSGVLREALLTENYFVLPAYIQYNLCDFGYNEVNKL